MAKEKEVELYELPLNQEEKEQIEKIQEKSEAPLKATIKIGEESKVSVKADFVIAFTANLNKLVEIGVNQTELKVILYILEVMEYGNLISLNQRAICKALDLKPSNVSQIFKKLKAKKVLIEDENKSLYMNSNLFAKGLSHRLDKEKRENMKKNQSNLFDEVSKKEVGLIKTI